MNFYEQWDAYLAKPESIKYLAERTEGKRGWIPRWMIEEFLREQSETLRSILPKMCCADAELLSHSIKGK